MPATLLAPAAPTRFATDDPFDPADLWRAVDRVAVAAFCTDLDPTVISFVRARIADHFAVADEVIDTMIATQLVSLAARLARELARIAAL